MKAISLITLTIVTALVSLGCASSKSTAEKPERGPSGTIAYYVDVETSEPGVKIEANNEYVGETPLKLKIWGDKDGTFHNFGSTIYVLRALPLKPGQLVQTKVFGTGGWFASEDRIPNRVYFDMNLAPASGDASAGGPSSTPTRGSLASTGTGFFITDDGFILTCHHVLENASEVKVKIGSDLVHAEIVRKDASADLAVLKVDKPSKALRIARSTIVRQGEEVYTMGFPKLNLQGQEAKFTEGSVSSLTGFQDDASAFQISVPVQAGNSGGPLVNQRAEVVGVVIAKLRGGENVNYAVKSSRAMVLLEEIQDLRIIPPSNRPGLSQADIAEELRASTVIILAY